MSRGVPGLDAQVVLGAVERLAELGAPGDLVEQLADTGAVALQQVLDAREVQPALGRQAPAPVPQHLEALGADERRTWVALGGTAASSPCAAASTASRAITR